jgi:hypothetical protein
MSLLLISMLTFNIRGKGLPECKADNFTAVSRLFTKFGIFDVSHPYGPLWPSYRDSFTSFLYTFMHIFCMVRRFRGSIIYKGFWRESQEKNH